MPLTGFAKSNLLVVQFHSTPYTQNKNFLKIIVKESVATQYLDFIEGSQTENSRIKEISVRKDLSLSSLFVKFAGMASDIPNPLL